MSLTYGQVSALTSRYILPKVVDGVYNSSAAIARHNQKKKLIGGGRLLEFPVISSKPGQGGFFTDMDTLNTNRTDNITNSSFSWKQLYEPIRVSRLELLQNSGKEQIVNLLTAKGEIAQTQIKENLSLGLFSDGTAATGTGSANQLTGYQAAISTTSTYGGIAVADMAEWAAKRRRGSSAGTAEAFTLGRLMALEGDCTEGVNSPTVFYCRQVVYNEIWGSFQPYQRLTSTAMAKLGFESVLEFNGKPVIVDSHMYTVTSNHALLAINENFSFLVVHKDEDMRKESIEKLETTASNLDKIFWAGNLCCNNRRFQGILEDISVAA